MSSGETIIMTGLRIRARFIERTQAQSRTEVGSDCENNSRRWGARTGPACKKRRDIVMAE